MKKTTHLFYILTIFLLTFNLSTYSQGCLPEGITFSTQQQIDSFQTNYPGCTEIEGDMTISGSGITNLYGLNVVTSIGGDLDISYNTNLVDFSGLNALESIGESLSVNYNNLLTFSGLESLSNIGMSIRIFGMYQLNDISALQGLSEICGYLEMDNLGLTDLEGLHNITSIGGYVRFWECHHIENFAGLQSLNYIGGDFKIDSNNDAINLSGLENLQIIGGNLDLSNNSFQSLDGLVGLHTVNGNVSITFNFDLLNLDGLNSLTFVDGGLGVAYCDAITDISGIQNVLPGSLNSLGFIHNQLLSDCDVESVCLYLAQPDAVVSILENAPGCNNPEEVEQTCLTGTEENVIEKKNIQIFPNPAKKTISIISSSQQKIDQIKIFNQTGLQVIKENIPGDKIDVSNLPPGLYFIEIKTETGIVRKKLIIQ